MAFRAAYNGGVMIMYKYIYTHPASSGSLKVGELIKILESLDTNKTLYIFDENGNTRPFYDIAQRGDEILLCDF